MNVGSQSIILYGSGRAREGRCVSDGGYYMDWKRAVVFLVREGKDCVY